MTRKFSWAALAAVLASTGLGLLIWLGVSVTLLQGGGADMVLLRSMQRTGLLIACVLGMAALYELRRAGSMPGAARWRSLAAAALVLALASTVALVVLLARRPPDATWVTPAAALLSLGAIGAVLALGMLAASGGRLGWRQQMVTPNCLAYALLSGAALLFALIAMRWPGQEMLSTPAPSMIMLLVVMAAVKFIYWFENGGLRAPIGERAGLDPLRSRLLVLALLVLLPLLLCFGLVLWPTVAPKTCWCLMVLSVLAGGYLDRLLLMAEAGRRSG